MKFYTTAAIYFWSLALAPRAESSIKTLTFLKILAKPKVSRSCA